MKIKTAHFQSTYRLDYLAKDNDGPLYICLHGYTQSGASFFKSIESVIPKNANILAPCGPFPLPSKARTAETLGYAWYFYDSQTDEYYISYSVPADLISQLVHSLGYQDKEKIIIGYSQGGYLAPFLAQELKQVKSVICINSSFRVDKMKVVEEKFLVHAINGADDDIVDPIQAQKNHEKLEDLQRRGDFHLVKDSNHRINKDILAILKTYLD